MELETEAYDNFSSEGNKTKPVEGEDLSPIVLARASNLGDQSGNYTFQALLDSGGTVTMINARCLPKGVEGKSASTKNRFTTTAGTFDSVKTIVVDGLTLPEFSATRKFGPMKMYVFDAPTLSHDIIIGRDTLRTAKMKLDFEDQKTIWHEDEVPFHAPKRVSAISTT